MVKQGYKQTEIGIIPEDWACVKIEDIARILMCKRIFADQTFDFGEIPFYKIGTFGKEADAYISRSLYNEFKRRFSFPKKGDVLISAAGTLGRTVVYDGKDAYFQDSNIVWLDVDESRVSNQYLKHYYDVIKWVSSEGSTIARLYNGIIYNTYIPLPSIEEQQKISEALSDVDSMISSLEKLIAKKKAIKQGAMQELLTGKKRLPGFTGEWKYEYMEQYLYFQVGYSFSSDYFNTEGFGLRLVKNRDLKSDDQIYYTNESYSQDFVVLDDDVLIGMDGDFLPCLWKKGKSLLNQRVGRVKTNEKMSLIFAYYLLQKPLQELQKGTGATTVKHLSHTDIAKLKIKIPVDVNEQTAIASVLSDMDSEIEALEQKFAKTRQLKQGMMQQLLTGKIRLV